MLRVKMLEPTVCAKCKGWISLVQVNGKTFGVETTAGLVGISLVVLEIHRCSNGEHRPLEPFQSGKVY